tara:strand:- start:38423 stop:39634 length:1212 start_codon:yes stop_codon:yes gene_type:complete
MIKERIIGYTKSSRALAALVLLLFVGDVLVKICVYAHYDFHNFSAITRGSFFILSLVVSFLSPTKFRKRMLLFLLSLTLFFFVGQYAFLPSGLEEHLFKNFIILSRYLFIFSILLFFDGIDTLPIDKKVLTTFEWVIIINTIAIFIGFLFDIKMLETYQSNRFGFSGLFLVPSIATFFYAISLSYLAFQLKKNTRYKILFSMVLLACLLVGTKALLLFVVLTLGHLFLLNKWYLNKLFYGVLVMLATILMLFRNTVISVLEKTFAILLNVYEESGFITMATSYRNVNLQTDLINMVDTHWGLVNYVFGGTNFTKYRVEFDFIDVLLFFGIVGGLLYLAYYFKYIIRYPKLSKFGKIQTGFLLGIGFLSGTFFNNAPVAVYLLVLLTMFTIKENEISNKKNIAA